MSEQTQDIALELIDEPQHAMRTDIPRDEIFELAADIKRNGLINPITVRPVGDRFEVVAGHRRFLAHRYGGIVKIRCIVRELNDEQVFSIMTSENLKREEVNYVDEAIHVSRLMNMHNEDIAKVADIVGRSKDWVETRMLVFRMPDTMKAALREKKIKLGVATALMEITDDFDRQTCLEMAISQGASAVIAQYWVAQWKAGLFGRNTGNMELDEDVPEGERAKVQLRCSIDGELHDAREFTTFLVWNNNAGYVEAMAQHMKDERAKNTLSPSLEEEVSAVESSSDGGVAETNPEEGEQSDR